MPARPRHGHVEQPALLRDHVLATPHERLEDGSGQLEARRAPRLRQAPLYHRRHEDRVELQALRLMNRHHLDRISFFHRRGLLVLSG